MTGDREDANDAGWRTGEEALPFDPAAAAPDAGLVFIGHAHTPWQERASCPKNMRQARERGGPASLAIDAPFRAGLRDLEPGAAIFVLTWFDRARRDLIVQRPKHRENATGVFSLRSPVRPNPIGLHLVRLIALDVEAGILALDALDCLDGTPVIDLKPWFETVDVPPA